MAKKPKILYKKKRQTAVEGYDYSPKLDSQRDALPPGKRISKNGNIYYEYRKNRTDLPNVDKPKRKTKVRKHTRNEGEVDVKKHDREITVKPASSGSKPPELSLEKQFEQKNDKLLQGQRGEEFQDIGDKFGGAKKDYYAWKRQLEWEDIIELEKNTADALQFITKAKVVQPIDEQQELANGTTTGAIYLKKLAYKYLANKPKVNSKEARAFYFQEATAIFESLKNISNVDQFFDYQREYNRSFWTRKERPQYVKDRLGTSFFGFMTRTTTSSAEKMATAKELEKKNAEINEVEELLEQKKKTPGEKGKTYRKPYLENIKRIGGKEIGTAKPDLIIEKLGLRGVEYGNWVNDKEAQKNVKHFIGSMYDLEDMTGIDVTKFNKKGKLGIAFGSRGSGRALAHFEPYRNVINLTKKNGDGSLAHEWGHYFDHVLKSQFGNKENNTGDSATFLTNDISNPKNKVQKAMKEVMDMMMNGDAVQEVVYEKPTRFRPSYSFKRDYEKFRSTGLPINELYETYVSRSRKRYERNLEVINKMYSGDRAEKEKKKELRKYNKDAKEIGQLIAYMEDKPVKLGTKTTRTEYYLRAQKQGSGKNDYWTSPHEMFARAFEGFVQDKLTSKGRKNNYLANATGTGMSEEQIKSENIPYPAGKEREKINLSIENFLNVLKSAQMGENIDIEHPSQEDNRGNTNTGDSTNGFRITNGTKGSIKQDGNSFTWTVRDINGGSLVTMGSASTLQQAKKDLNRALSGDMGEFN